MLYFVLPILLLLKVVDIKKFINIINGRGYESLENIVLNTDYIKRGLSNKIKKVANEQLTKEEFKIELEKIYNTIFNNTCEMVYSGKGIILNKGSYNHLMQAVSLLKLGLKYK